MKNKGKKEEQQENVEENEVEEEATEFIQQKYDPTLTSRIICIELENNQKIYLNYTENSTIKDLINTILKRHEYKMLNFNRANIIYSKNFPSLYDLSLSFYDGIKPAYENKLNLNVLIDELHIKGFLKSHREPFLIFKENYTPQDYIISKKHYSEELKKIKEKNFNFFAKYYNYLPRQARNVPNLYLAHPELENYFRHNQKGYNNFTIYHRNNLTCEDEKIDWLIYDKESINFLLNMNKLQVKEISSLKYKNNLAFFEDKCQIDDSKKSYSNAMNYASKKRTRISEKQLQKVYLNLTINIAPPDQPIDVISNKMKVTLTTTAFNLIEKMCSKLMNIKKGLVIDIKKKILKVKGLNDYIFSVDEPIVNYTYFIECVKLNKIPEYLIVDNPLGDRDNQSPIDYISAEKEEVDAFRTSLMPTSTLNERKNIDKNFENNLRKTTVQTKTMSNKSKNELEKLAFYEKAKDDKLIEEYLKTDLDKKVNRLIKPNNATNSNNDINNLVNSLVKDISKKTFEESGKKSITSTTIQKNKSEIEHEPDKPVKNLLKNENLFLSLNPNNSEYFSLRKKYKQKQPKIPKNLFFNENTNINVKTKKPTGPDYRLKIPKQLENKSRINITDVNREFNIIFRSAYIDSINNYNSTEYDSKNAKTVLLFKFELFCSNHSIGTAKQIRWKTNTKVNNPIFNKRIYFERNYNKLPNFCSLLITVKFIQYDKSGQVFKSNTKFWANYRLFDEDNKLKVGLQKVNLQSREVSDDVYYCYNDNPDEENSSKIYFEIENFANPVEYKINLKGENKNIKNIGQYELNPKIYDKLEKINKKSVFEELNNNEKNILWSNRLGIAKMVSELPRLLQSCNYKNPNANQELQKIFKNAEGVTIVQAIEFLSGRYVNEVIREFAVSVLKKATFTDISYYLLQLIQALKYEKNIDNPLARFLLEQAIIHPITIGHEFFWHLRAEMYNPEVQKRFGLYLEVFLNKISDGLYKIFKDEDYLLKELVRIAIKVKEKIPKEERDKRFKEDLAKINSELVNKKKEISLPLNFKYRIRGINYNKGRIMKSKKKPLWLTFKNADPLGEDIVVMLKCGDDLRMDMVTLQLFQAMQTLWFDGGLNLKMSLYKIICTGYQQGMLEMVTNSETLASIHVKEGGAISQFFSKAPIKNWIEKNCLNVSKEEAIENFLISNVAYCLATFVLGIGDRHNDNIMLKKNGELFHIDFGHFLGHFKYKMGIKRERAPFVFTRQFQNVLGNDNSELFLKFKEYLQKGYLILRKNKEVIVTLMRILLCTGIPELNEKSLRYLENTLSMKREDKEAKDYLDKQLADSLDSVSTKLNFAIHIVANK